MKNQVSGESLFCMYGECTNVALFDDYCEKHSWQVRAEREAADLRAQLAQVTAERDAARHNLSALVQAHAAYTEHAMSDRQELLDQRDTARRGSAAGEVEWGCAK